MNTRWSMANLI